MQIPNAARRHCERMTLVCLLLLASCFSLIEGFSGESLDFLSEWELFQNYTDKYDRHYETTTEEFHRFDVFRASLKRIAALNAKDPNEPYGLTIFSDLTETEFRSHYLGFRATDKTIANAQPADITTGHSARHLPEAFDWRDIKGTVTHVKDQGPCGSCWAFSAVENIESIWAIQGGHQLVELSVQQVVDCDHNFAHGCNGGERDSVYDYVVQAGGLERERDYPYVGREGKCRHRASNDVVTVDGFERLPWNETAMRVHLYHKGPLSICIDASTWQHYRGGVVKRKCGGDIDHCVVITGYDVSREKDVPYWIVRNSWGVDWGIGGYINLEMFKDECALAKMATSAYIRR